MRETPFFDEIEHFEVPWGKRIAMCPVFFYDIMSISLTMMAPTERVKSFLPSARMHPYRVMPGKCLVSIAAQQIRDSDIGPYNEFYVAIPITIDEPTPLFVGSLRKAPVTPMAYFHQMPVTTEIARDLGVEFSAFPKFIAQIDIEESENWVTCTLGVGSQHILTMAGRKLATKTVGRSRVYLITHRRKHLLRAEFVTSQSEMGISKDKDDYRLDLGDGQIADELRAMELGKVISYSYSPQHQAIETPSYESYEI